ncbi:MAG: DUF1846 domain-containing protein [Erysipelotrichaceae bacterium]|nr:DUF1846 domain-containing protein [Erysipelotrichaceae bacterium]
MSEIAFDSAKYIKMQSEKIMERVNQFNNKLYLEFGGKLFDDNHAARVLPGFTPDIKVKMLASLADKVEILIVINANDIQKNKIRGDLGITYDQEVLRLIDAFRDSNLYVGSVVITQYANQDAADKFRQQLERLSIRTYLHYPIIGYPADVALIVSDDGYGRNEYIQTSRPLIVVTAPGPGSGKMATCLSQLYHEHQHQVDAGYAKFETFPIWNLPLKHPVNLAYEAATADLDDVNVIDPFHLDAYGIKTVNYNRDVEVFPVLAAIFKRIANECPYKSPTDMGVNMVGFCIADDQAAIQASKDEIIRRYYHAMVDWRLGMIEESVTQKIRLVMNQAGVTPADRPAVAAALHKAELTGAPAVAIELTDGRIVTGKTSALLGASSAALLNALKILAHINDDVLLISPNIIEPIQELKVKMLGNHNPRLHTDELLIALAISAQMNPSADKALKQLPDLAGTQIHSSVILSTVDSEIFRKLKMNLTCEPVYQTKKLFHKK